MYKSQNTATGVVAKSYDILDIYTHVIENPTEDTQFYIDYKPYRKSEFLKLFLQECKDYNMYSRLYNAVYNEITITNYVKNQE